MRHIQNSIILKLKTLIIKYYIKNYYVGKTVLC